MSANTTRRNVLLLALCQALFFCGNTLIVTSSALVGAQLAPHPALTTLPAGLQFAGMLLATVPASLLMRRLGRRIGFSMGAIIGVLAGGLGTAAILDASFVGFCIATVLYGAFAAHCHYFRFAATDTADESYRSRAIAYVMAGGVVAAILGPEMAKASIDLFAPILFAGCFVVIAGLGLGILLTVQFVSIPRLSSAQQRLSGRPLSELARQPRFIVAVLAAMVAYASMSLIMTVTPLAMLACDLDFDQAAFVIQWHALGMFAPSFFSGHLVRRFGAHSMIVLGALLSAACAGINLTGIELVHFWSGLLLLGVGWNFMFVGATALLTSVHSPAEAAKVQALNEVMLFSLVALAAFSSGALHELVGWQAVNAGVLPALLLVVVVTSWAMLADRSRAATAG